jgi:hypothetical protein
MPVLRLGLANFGQAGRRCAHLEGYVAWAQVSRLCPPWTGETPVLRLGLANLGQAGRLSYALG